MEEDEENTNGSSNNYGGFLMNDYCNVIQTSPACLKAEELAETVRNSNEFKNYEKQIELLKSYPDKYDFVNRIRRKRFELQNGQTGDPSGMNDSDMTMNNDPVIKDFLSAELELGRLVQNINEIITESIDIDTSFLD